MLGEPAIADLIIDQPAINACLANFVNGYLRHRWGIIPPGQTKYVIYPRRHRNVYSWLALTSTEKTLYDKRITRLVKKFGNTRIMELFWDLPEDIRFKKCV